MEKRTKSLIAFLISVIIIASAYTFYKSVIKLDFQVDNSEDVTSRPSVDLNI